MTDLSEIKVDSTERRVGELERRADIADNGAAVAKKRLDAHDADIAVLKDLSIAVTRRMDNFDGTLKLGLQNVFTGLSARQWIDAAMLFGIGSVICIQILIWLK